MPENQDVLFPGGMTFEPARKTWRCACGNINSVMTRTCLRCNLTVEQAVMRKRELILMDLQARLGYTSDQALAVTRVINLDD